MGRKLLGCLALLLLTNTASAAAIANVSPAKANGDFIDGSGIPGDSFWVDGVDIGPNTAIKARSRDTGDPLAIVGNRFYVRPGLASDNVSPWWSFDFQFSPGIIAAASTAYGLRLEVDFNPAFGVENYVTIDAPVNSPGGPVDSWAETGDLKLNPGSGAWTNDMIPFVVANSLHLGFAFWQAPPFNAPAFNPNVAGEYALRLTGYFLNGPGPGDDAVLASSTILVEVTPEPASMLAWAGLGLCVAGGRRWKKRKATA